jgi:glucokinase
MAVIGLDLGGTKLAGAIFSQSGQILRRAVTPLTGRRGREIGELVRLQVATLLNVARTKHIEVRAIGVCVPGIARSETGRVWAPNLPGWEDYPLRDEIVSSLGRPRMRVVVDNDRAACILGEAWQGAALGCRDAIFLAVGTGIGAGILVDGQVLRGTHDIAGSIGWLALDLPFRREYAGGCFEYHASGGGLAKVAKEILAGRKKYSGSLRNKSSLTARDVFAAYAQGDVVAKKVLAQAVEFWGMAVANLVSLLNPEKIIFGGGVFGPARRFLPDIKVEAEKWAQPISIRQVEFVNSQLGSDAGLYGAAFLALQSLNKCRRHRPPVLL